MLPNSDFPEQAPGQKLDQQEPEQPQPQNIPSPPPDTSPKVASEALPLINVANTVDFPLDMPVEPGEADLGIPEGEEHTFSRRTALKLMGGAAVGGAIAYSRFHKPKPYTYQPDNIALPYLAQEKKRVVVIGGGLAGLANAYELSERGFQVTLIEKSPQLGGKIASWSIDVNGESLQMEHGFHGFFPQYYNLWKLTEELNIRQDFVSLDHYSVVYQGKPYRPEVFQPSRSSFPWNIVDLTVSSPNRLKWGINLTKPFHWEVFHAITSFDSQRTYAALDHLSVEDWGEGGFPKGLYDLYFLPFGKSTLNSPDVLSAGELMQFFHFYFFGNPEGLAFNGTRQDMGRTLVDPIGDRVTAKGGEILTETQVERVEWKDGRVTAVDYRPAGSVSAAPFWVERNGVMPSDENWDYFGAGDAVFAAEIGGDRALSLTCTHQGCTVGCADDKSWSCPCHGASYNSDGTLKNGPAKRSLPQYKILRRQGNRVQLAALNADTDHSQLTRLEADYFVFAADVRGVRHLFDLADGEVDSGLDDAIAKLPVADPFAVARFWFDRDFEWAHSEFTSLSGYRLTDSITRYHKIQDDYKKWHEKTGGSVVELHAYCYKEKEFPTQTALLETFENELYDLVPELRSANMLHRQLVNQKNFSGYPPNSYRDRPSSRSGAPNLFFAGDWVKMPFPCGLMERAVSSGLLAANEICHDEGLQRRTLYTVRPKGILPI